MFKRSINQQLASQAKHKGICKQWHKDLRNTTDRAAMVEMYLRGIDFCLKNDFPANDFIKAHFSDIAPRMGVFVDSEISVENKPKCVCLGATFGKVSTDGFNVSEVFVKHDSEINLVAADNAFVMIDVFDNSIVNIYAHDRAKVCVNQYGDRVTVNVVSRDPETHVKIRVKHSNSY